MNTLLRSSFFSVLLISAPASATVLECHAVNVNNQGEAFTRELTFSFENSSARVDVTDQYKAANTQTQMVDSYSGRLVQTPSLATFFYTKDIPAGNPFMVFTISVNRTTLKLIGNYQVMGHVIPMSGLCTLSRRPAPNTKF